MNKTAGKSIFISTFKRHSSIALGTFIATIVTSALYLIITPKQYKASAKLIVGEQEVSISELGQQLTDRNSRIFSRSVDPVATQAELVKSSQILERVLQDLEHTTGTPKKKLPSVQTLKRVIDVEIVPATNILRLTYYDLDPKIAVELVNSLAKSVVQQNIDTNRLTTTALRELLDAKIAEQQLRLQQAETAESNYRQAQGLVNFEAQTTGLVKSLTELENEERSLLAQLRETTTKKDLLQTASGLDNLDKAYTALRINQDKELQKLQNELKDLEAKISSRRSYLTEQAPELQALLEERNSLRASYKQKLSDSFTNNEASFSSQVASNSDNQDLVSQYISIQIEHQSLENKLQTVRAELNNLRTRVTQIPEAQKPLGQLIRQRETATASLKSLQSKLEEVKIAETQSNSGTRIIFPATIDNTPHPNPTVVLVVGTAAGIFLAVTVVFYLSVVDDSLHSTIEAEETLGLPILGVLPNIFTDDANTPDLKQFLDNSILVEPYRELLKTLEFSSNQNNPAIVISGIAFGEGKSSVALCLASVAAMLSRRTLIIDADLRQPLQDQLLGVPSYPGLTEVLENPSTFISVVRPTNIENLSVLTHGQLNNRPAALIESKSMKVLLEAVREFYDLVIIDSSPASICSDVTTLSQLTNGLVLVVRPNFTSKEIILETISKLKKNNTSITGVVINEIEANKTRYLSGKKDNIVKLLKNPTNI
ncbi:MAG: GumC family protein [Pleurocapsa sp.]